MEKRLILAIGLSLLILLTWSRFVAKTQLIDTQKVTTESSRLTTLAPSPLTTSETARSATHPITPMETPSPSLVQQPEISPSSLLTLSQHNQEIKFIEPNAAIKEVIFKDYQSYPFPLEYGFLFGSSDMRFIKKTMSSGEATFVYQDTDKQITKKFIFAPDNYYLELEIQTQNISPASISVELPLTVAFLNFTGDQLQRRFQDISVATAEKVWRLNGHKDITLEGVKFLSLRDRYFCVVVAPETDNYVAGVKKINQQGAEIFLRAQAFSLAPGQQARQKFRIYLGPQDLKLITNVQSDWSAVVYYGAFDVISHLLLQTLDIIHRIVRNWGLAIIILGLLIYLLLFPLTLKQMRSMKEMQALQPRVEELRRVYKDNPQKLNKEIMQLYREHKVNPLGGCLPLLLQIPIFFALYQALMRSVVLKGARFLWIKDLSQPDRLFILPRALPVLGNEVNILPILMAIGMFLQQRFTMAASGGTSREQQRMMLIMFPLMFGFIFYHMPSGLVLYWFTNSTLMLLHQLRIRHQR